jgi:hypothetical protein
MATLLLLIAAATTALLRNPGSETLVTAPPAPAEAGMMAYIDPETGELTTGPAPANALTLDAELQNALRRDDAGLDVVTRADGTKVLNLQGRYQHASVIHIGENGATTVCTDNAAAVAHELTHPPVANANAPEVK